MLGRHAGKRRSHPNRYSVGFQHQHSLSAQPEIGFAYAADVGTNTFSYTFQRWPLPGLCEVPVNRQFRLRIKTHENEINLSGTQESTKQIESLNSQQGFGVSVLAYDAVQCAILLGVKVDKDVAEI